MQGKSTYGRAEQISELKSRKEICLPSPSSPGQPCLGLPDPQDLLVLLPELLLPLVRVKVPDAAALNHGFALPVAVAVLGERQKKEITNLRCRDYELMFQSILKIVRFQTTKRMNKCIPCLPGTPLRGSIGLCHLPFPLAPSLGKSTRDCVGPARSGRSRVLAGLGGPNNKV